MVDLLCMGEPMLEFNQLPPLPDGSVHYLEGHGGDTSNAAVAAARQGASVGYITAIGTDAPGDSFMAMWAREGVDTGTVIRTDRALTGVYFVTHDAAGHHFLHYRKDSPAALYGPADVPHAALAAARMFYVSGISQGISPSAADAVFAAIDTCRRNGVAVAYDTNYRPRLWPPVRAAAVIHAAMALADYAFPGMDDALVLTGLADPDAIL
ncbi:MAG TPA: sugar kinase, partial [Acetobacteraceae bacterium]|nr:sugar kinase [Acetobacteraceae bacterium]